MADFSFINLKLDSQKIKNQKSKIIQVYINIFLDKYTYKSIKLYIIKLSSHVHELVHETYYYI